MKAAVLLVVLLHASLLSLAAVIEVFEEAESVLLPCYYGGTVPEEPSVIWTRTDHNPNVFLLRQEGSDPRGQNQIYRGRTSMGPDALETGTYSLTFRDPQLSDTGRYICSLSDGLKELKLTEVQLNVKDVQVEVKVNMDAESVVLPCKASADLPKDTTVEWTRSEPQQMFVQAYPYTVRQCTEWDDRYCGRTRMNEDLLRTGDLSLTLRFPTTRDSGRYTCTVHRDKDILRQRVDLELVKPPAPGLPTWTAVLLVVLLVLLVLGLFAAVLYNFQHYFMPVVQVQVESGAESVLLPCRTLFHLPEDAQVEWRDSRDRMVHLYRNGSDHLPKQNQDYRSRTRMNEDLLRTGDLSLTLTWPTDADSYIYICRASSRKGKVLMKRQVELKVKVSQQVEVDSGAESVLLPCRTSVQLPGDARVEWRNRYKKVHVYQNGSDQPEQLSRFYRTRTRMDENLLRTGDLSVTLEHPTDADSETYTCSVYSSKGGILMRKQVQLEVKVCEVEVEEGAESVLLPFRTSAELPGDAELEWRRGNYVTIHVYQNGSEWPEKQDQFYRTRTSMEEDPLRTGDLSVTLRRPTVRDSGPYRCDVHSLRGNLQREKLVLLRVTAERKQDHEATPLLLLGR